MTNVQRMRRQLELLEALTIAEEEMRAAGGLAVRADITIEAAATLVLAARIEEFCDTFGENIHRAGEGI
jgi:hypothetical protein